MKNIRKDFARNVFDRAKMKKYLPPKVYLAVTKNKVTSEEIAEEFAKGLKKWAMSQGVTRFMHWFQPLNNFTAGKRDSLCSVNGKGDAIVKFRGKELTKGEGDASSFPSGGIRQTFEARGVTTWDSLSQAFVKDGCLFIPTTFCSFTGEALDKKTPLLRSCDVLNKQALRLLQLAGCARQSVVSVVGAEQEYFLIDKEKYMQRADLVYTGRTLVGAQPPKGQEFFDHYYRPPNKKTLDFWQEVNDELWKLGIVAKTEHKEVAPNQFELAPCYASVNIACDQNQIVMHTLQSVADKFGLVCLLHEKPFAKLNGSGKHNNWSLLTDRNENLFEQGNTPLEQARFVLFLACVLRAVDLHQDLLRFAVASASNDCRLGGFEAPPQTVSVFLGDIFSSLQNALSNNWQMGKDLLPKTVDCTDRNRTSPFAFTGNKFEFRTVGSSASLADCNTVLNTIVADSVAFFADSLSDSQDFWKDAQKLVSEVLEKHGKIVFNGNNYSESWQQQAQSRGLLNVSNAFLAAKCLSDEKNTSLFQRNGVFTQRELLALQQIFWENYADTVCLESNVTADICLKQIVPTLQKHLANVLEIAVKKQQILQNNSNEKAQAKEISQLIETLQQRATLLLQQRDECKATTNAYNKAQYAADTLISSMAQVREIADKAESVCPQELWPMPTYGELLFSL
ncbi:MAG: glutamine synthetase III [Candidatus Fimimonas sp.]